MLVQENWVDYSDAVYDRVGNILMSRLMGAEVELVDQGFGIGFKESWENALEDIRRRGGKPYAIPAGASDHRLGGLGFVGFAEEVRAQEAALGFRFDYIFVCSVTGSTQAGMVVGFAADGRADRVIGIDASAKPDATDAQILRIAENTADLVEPRPAHHQGRCRARPRATPTRPMACPRRRRTPPSASAARLEGMMTDPVYEGKSMQGMIDMISRGEIPAGSRVLYAHLGGVPAINAYSFLYRNG